MIQNFSCSKKYFTLLIHINNVAIIIIIIICYSQSVSYQVPSLPTLIPYCLSLRYFLYLFRSSSLIRKWGRLSAGIYIVVYQQSSHKLTLYLFNHDIYWFSLFFLQLVMLWTGFFLESSLSIYIFNLGTCLIKTLVIQDAGSMTTSPFIRWESHLSLLTH